MSEAPSSPRRLWQVAGALAVVHLALMPAGFALQDVGRLGDPPGALAAVYRGSPLGTAGLGQAVSLLGFVAFLVLAPLLARLLRGGTEGTRWAAGVIAAAGAAYVAVTLGSGFAGADAARFAAHGGAPASTVAALSNLHWFGDFLATTVLGVFTVAVAVGAWATRLLPRWVAALGSVVGAGCLACAVNPPESVLDDATLAWMVWFVALAAAAFRAGRVRAQRPAVPVTAATT